MFIFYFLGIVLIEFLLPLLRGAPDALDGLVLDDEAFITEDPPIVVE
jgi:hypothetical protein